MPSPYFYDFRSPSLPRLSESFVSAMRHTVLFSFLFITLSAEFSMALSERAILESVWHSAHQDPPSTPVCNWTTTSSTFQPFDSVRCVRNDGKTTHLWLCYNPELEEIPATVEELSELESAEWSFNPKLKQLPKFLPKSFRKLSINNNTQVTNTTLKPCCLTMQRLRS